MVRSKKSSKDTAQKARKDRSRVIGSVGSRGGMHARSNKARSDSARGDRAGSRSGESRPSWQTALIYAVVGLIGVYLLIVMFRSVKASAVLDKQDRINIVFYGEEAVLLSLGLSDDVHYIVSFSHGDKVTVPGGYGRYLVGSLAKLAELEKDPDLMSRTFGSMASAYVNYYVMPKDSDVFEKPDTDTPAFDAREFVGRLFSRGYETNASFVDKIYLATQLANLREQDFVVLRSISQQNEEGELEFSERRFLKKYKGFFFQQSLRQEGLEVQFLYDLYPSAVALSRIIEGQGIRVVDLSEKNEDQNVRQRCIVKEAATQQSKTAFYIQKRLGCVYTKGDVEGADIQITMGDELSQEWK